MYTQNGSRDTRFEALIVNVPWPQWLAELEHSRYDNEKYVPITLVDNTLGYDSECAVLFPETVSIAGKPANHFGAILCDREAERFRRRLRRRRPAGLNVPPDAALLRPSSSPRTPTSCGTIHDRAHSHGDLPFDPFMICQRMPYWMYSLEELRCDHRVRRGDGAERMGRRTPATRSTRSSSTGSPLPGDRSRVRTMTGSAASSCSPTCTTTTRCGGRTTA